MIGGIIAGLAVGCARQATDHGSVSGALPQPDGPLVEYLLEGESLTALSGAFSLGPAAGAAGEEALVVAPGLAKAGKLKGQAELVLPVVEATHLHVWLRVKWTGTCSNSVIVKAPGLPAKIVGESATYETWHWVQGPSFDAAVGDAKVLLQVREDGIFVDQILVTSDSRRVPVGIESPPAGEEQAVEDEKIEEAVNDSGE
jgi:hypothetical protein